MNTSPLRALAKAMALVFCGLQLVACAAGPSNPPLSGAGGQTPVATALPTLVAAGATLDAPDVTLTPSPAAAGPTTPTAPTRRPTATCRPTATLTPTPLPTLVVAETVAMVCQGPPQAFNLFETLGIRWIANLRFESETLLTFEGWTDRPEPSILPRTPEPTTEPGMARYGSTRILLTGGQLDLLSRELSPRPLDVDTPLANPCGETCPLEVLGQSPNGQWQLVQVTDWLRAQIGLWLVSAETAVQLVPYVPPYPEWQWANDSSTLWLTYFFDEIGGETLVIRLENPPDVHESRYGGPLNPAGYWLGYSPVDNMAFAVPAPEIRHENREGVFTVALDDDPEKASGVWDMPGVVSVAWNEATRRITAQVVNESGVTFRELPGGLALTIPNDTLASLFPSFTNATDALPNGISAMGDWAFSTSGAKLALFPNPAVVWLFDCVPTS